MKTKLINRIATSSLASLVAVLMSTTTAVQNSSAQTLILSDNYNVTGGNSPSTGFGSTGVNYEVSSRLSGSVFSSNPGMNLLRTGVAKSDTAYSILGNQLNVADQAGPGAFQYSADGISAFDFGSSLAGKTYEIRLTLTQGEVENVVRRGTFYITDAVVSDVTLANYGFQLASNAVSGGTESAFQRLRADASPTGVVNSSVASGLAYNQPVEFRLVVTDSTDYTAGIYLSSYQLFVNNSLASSGNFRFSNGSRYLAFDVAPDSGPISYNDFSVTVIPEPSTLALGIMGTIGLLVLRRKRFNQVVR